MARNIYEKVEGGRNNVVLSCPLFWYSRSEFIAHYERADGCVICSSDYNAINVIRNCNLSIVIPNDETEFSE